MIISDILLKQIGKERGVISWINKENEKEKLKLKHLNIK